MQQRLGKYTLGGMIGQGGMGAVFESHHPQLGRPVAVKLLAGSLASDPSARQRFLREAQTAAMLSHPGIVNILDVDEDAGRPFIVMEKLEGGSLAGQLARGPLAPDEALRLAHALAEALDYAHRQGVVHRDIKPANVLLRPDGTPVLADFGLARPMAANPADQITMAGTLLGTLAYMAPEQFKGAAADSRSDIYALGVVLYELLAGRLPFDGDSGQILRGHLQDEPPAIRHLRPDIPPDAERLALRMLAKDPAARPQTAAEVARDLRAVMERGAAVGPTVQVDMSAVPRLAPGARSHRPRRAALIGAGALAGLLVVVGLVLLGQSLAGGRPRVTVIVPTLAPLALGGSQPGSPALTPVALRQVDRPRIAGAEPAGAGAERFSVGGVTYRADTDSIWFRGEVRNDGAAEREAVEVRISLLDESGQEVLSKTGYAERSYLAPGDVSPFSVLFTDDDGPLPEVGRYRVEVRSRAADFEPRTTVRELRINEDLQVGSQQYSSSVVVRGQVRNESDRPSQFTEVVVVFYDEDGAVVGIGSTYAEVGDDDRIAPGGSAPFSLGFVSLSGTPAAFYVYAEGRSYAE